MDLTDLDKFVDNIDDNGEEEVFVEKWLPQRAFQIYELPNMEKMMKQIGAEIKLKIAELGLE